MVDQLGPFQDIWEAWDEARDELSRKPISHFRQAVELQFDELEQHRRAGKHDKAAREAIDIISIALNLLRMLGYQPDEVADLARARARDRMSGKALDILRKYRELYDI
jgi:hypothetical protein